MSKLRSALAVFLLLAPYACGGESKRSVGDATGGTGGTGTGGTGKGDTGGSFTTGGSGGSSATGGTGGSFTTGGSMLTGGSGGRGGGTVGGAGAFTAGAGGDLNRCSRPAPMLYSCDAGASWYYHDGMTGECVGVGPDQCGPGGYSTLADCMSDCPGSKPALTACDHGYECSVVPAGCCLCDPVSAEQLIPVNSQRSSEVGCTEIIPCPACFPMLEEIERTRQYFIPQCFGGNCQLTDLRGTSYTACLADAECHLRDGAECCPGCDGTGIVALYSSEYLSDICDPTVDCAACEPQIPADLEAYCDPDWVRCAVRSFPNGGATGAAGAGGAP